MFVLLLLNTINSPLLPIVSQALSGEHLIMGCCCLSVKDKVRIRSFSRQTQEQMQEAPGMVSSPTAIYLSVTNSISTLTNFGAARIWLRLLRLMSFPPCAEATSLKAMKKPCKRGREGVKRTCQHQQSLQTHRGIQHYPLIQISFSFWICQIPNLRETIATQSRSHRLLNIHSCVSHVSVWNPPSPMCCPTARTS